MDRATPGHAKVSKIKYSIKKTSLQCLLNNIINIHVVYHHQNKRDQTNADCFFAIGMQRRERETDNINNTTEST